MGCKTKPGKPFSCCAYITRSLAAASFIWLPACFSPHYTVQQSVFLCIRSYMGKSVAGLCNEGQLGLREWGLKDVRVTQSSRENKRWDRGRESTRYIIRHAIITSLSLHVFLFLFTSFRIVAAISAEWSGIELALPTVSLKAPGPRGTIAMLIEPRLLLCEKKRPELLMGWGRGGFLHHSKAESRKS